jgi:hypothetical protein
MIFDTNSDFISDKNQLLSGNTATYITQLFIIKKNYFHATYFLLYILSGNFDLAGNTQHQERTTEYNTGITNCHCNF